MFLFPSAGHGVKPYKWVHFSSAAPPLLLSLSLSLLRRNTKCQASGRVLVLVSVLVNWGDGPQAGCCWAMRPCDCFSVRLTPFFCCYRMSAVLDVKLRSSSFCTRGLEHDEVFNAGFAGCPLSRSLSLNGNASAFAGVFSSPCKAQHPEPGINLLNEITVWSV